MTPREFERLLSQHAFPQEPIKELTHLFEEVRYGRKMLGEEEEKNVSNAFLRLSGLVRKKMKKFNNSCYVYNFCRKGSRSKFWADLSHVARSRLLLGDSI